MKFHKPEEEGIKTSDLIKRFLFIFCSIVIILAGITTVLYVSSARNELSIIENQEIKNISAISKLIIKSFDSTIADVLFLEKLSSSYISGDQNKTKFLDAVSSFLSSKDYYSKITLLDKNGNILLRLKAENRKFIELSKTEGNLRNNIDYKSTLPLARGHLYLSDFQLDDDIPVIVFGICVFDKQGSKKAVMLVSFNCKPIFEILKTAFEHPSEQEGKSARYFIVNAEGYWIKGPKPEDEFGFLYSARREKTFDRVFPNAWKKITIDQTGQIFTSEGLFTFTTFYPVARAEKACQQTTTDFDYSSLSPIKSFDYVWKFISFVPKHLCTIQSATRLKEFLLYDSVLILFFIVVSWIIARITLKKEYAEKILEQLSVTDSLTGLYNRRGFFLLAEQQLKIAERMKQFMVLFFLDLDDLKNINDRYGHLEGDIAIVRTAEILKQTFRQSDIVGRVGGDEFIALVIQNSPVDVETIIQRLQKTLDAANEKIEKGYKISISIGYSVYEPGKELSIDNLISIADKMMYANKRQKKKINN